MSPILFYLGALTLCGLSFILIREPSSEAASAGTLVESKGKRRFVGRVLIGLAALFAGTGAIAQLFSSYH